MLLCGICACWSFWDRSPCGVTSGWCDCRAVICTLAGSYYDPANCPVSHNASAILAIKTVLQIVCSKIIPQAVEYRTIYMSHLTLLIILCGVSRVPPPHTTYCGVTCVSHHTVLFVEYPVCPHHTLLIVECPVCPTTHDHHTISSNIALSGQPYSGSAAQFFSLL